jgi:hypothetical protein
MGSAGALIAPSLSGYAFNNAQYRANNAQYRATKAKLAPRPNPRGRIPKLDLDRGNHLGFPPPPYGAGQRRSSTFLFADHQLFSLCLEVLNSV